MNKFISLCKNTTGWPNTLRQLGYEAQLIEQEVSLESAAKVTPEVIAVSKKLLHAIAAECKGGGYIDDDQYGRYKQLKAKDLYYAGVDVHAPDQLTHVVCYVDDESNHASFVQHVSMPFITFGTVRYTQPEISITRKQPKNCENRYPLRRQTSRPFSILFHPTTTMNLLCTTFLSGCLRI